MANHRADGRATVRKHRAVGGTHRDSALPASALKVGVLGVLATATNAAPLAAAAAGIDEAAPQGEALAQAQPAAPAQQPAAAIAPVALPAAEDAQASNAAVETRDEDSDASRSEERTRSESEAAPSFVRSATRFGAAHWSSRVSSINTIRSPVVAISARSALTSVVLPVEVPPATSTFFRSRTAAFNSPA